MNKTRSTHRRRGVRASRVKLNQALANIGLKTQAALAERIASLEGQDSIPRDVVGRVFREQPVDLQTLERIARALGIEAFKLYLTADEENKAANAPAPEDEPQSQIFSPEASATSTAVSVSDEAPKDTHAVTVDAPVRVRRPWIAWGIATIAAAFLVMAAHELHLFGSLSSATRSVAASLRVPGIRRPRVIVLQFKGDPDGRLAVSVIDLLRPHVGTGSAALEQIVGDETAGEIAERMHGDAVISGEVVEVGQLRGVRAYLFHAENGTRKLIWAESFPTGAGPARLPAVGKRISLAVRRSMGLPDDGVGLVRFPSAKAQDEFLHGRLLMDRVHSELNLRRAQGHFEAAIHEDPDYGAAYANLCVATLEAYWVGNEQRQIEDAEISCDRATRVAPDEVDSLRAQAALLSKTGRVEEAIEISRRAVAMEPADMESVLGLANGEFTLFRQTGAAKWGALALEHARMAVALTPRLSKPYQALATYQFYVNSVSEAVPTFEKAHALDPENDYVIANLGTMYMCVGYVEKARELYLRARTVAPASYTGNEFLGGVYFYLGDYTESARLRQLGVDGATAGGGGDIHQMFGGLGDSYRRAGESAKAVTAYRKAFEIVERDFLTENGAISDKAFRSYYFAQLQKLENKRTPAAIAEALNRDLDQVLKESTDPSALLKLAQTWILENRLESAKQALDKAIGRCPGLARHPDMESLATSRANAQ